MTASVQPPGDSRADVPAASAIKPKSFFAPAERSDSATFQRELELLSNNPFIDGLMQAMSGLLAVLNEHRQILALNQSLLQLLGISDADGVLGLRVGEAVGCVHAHEQPGGCGTSEYCSNCGAAIAQVASLAQNRAAEGVCAIESRRPGFDGNLFFRIRAHPMACGGRRILLLFMQDISQQQQAAALERVFFHDLNNTVTGILGMSDFLASELEGEPAGIARGLFGLAQRLAREIEFQRSLAGSQPEGFQPVFSTFAVDQFLDDLRRMSDHHPAACGKHLQVVPPSPTVTLSTDPALLLRIVYNMVINALEATDNGGEVRLRVETGPNAVDFCVWNRGEIPAGIGRRIFQRNFSTKEASGRGLGTYSMRLLGEKLLGGQVTFSTSPTAGTCFRLHLPTMPDPGNFPAI
jgi:signal transduction histidine kinase